MSDPPTTFIFRDGTLRVRRGVHLSMVRVGGRPLRWGPEHADVAALAREMLVAALEDEDPPDQLVSAFAAEVVMALPRDRFEIAAADVLAWVADLGTSQREDLREERRPRRLNELTEYDDAPRDPARDPVAEAGGGVAEGFEAAEAALVRHATHAEAGGDPTRDAFPAEAEVTRSVYADADGAPTDEREEEKTDGA